MSLQGLISLLDFKNLQRNEPVGQQTSRSLVKPIRLENSLTQCFLVHQFAAKRQKEHQMKRFITSISTTLGLVLALAVIGCNGHTTESRSARQSVQSAGSDWASQFDGRTSYLDDESTTLVAKHTAAKSSFRPLVAENGSYYGQLNANGVPKTVNVRSYHRKDGTYVRGHYRSKPYSNPPRRRR